MLSKVTAPVCCWESDSSGVINSRLTQVIITQQIVSSGWLREEISVLISDEHAYSNNNKIVRAVE